MLHGRRLSTCVNNETRKPTECQDPFNRLGALRLVLFSENYRLIAVVF